MKFWRNLLRDYFAGKALPSLLMCDFPSKVPEWAKGLTVDEFIARKAYKMADAMLKARKS